MTSGPNGSNASQTTPVVVTDSSYFTSGNYYHRHWLELLEDGRTVSDKVVCPFVNTLQAMMPSAVTRTFPLDGEVYEEHQGFRQRTFRLAGRSGFTEYDLGKFYKFRNFLEKYQRLSRDNKNAFVRFKDVRLVMNFAWEGEAYYATVTSFAYTRTTGTSRLSYEYVLDIVTNGAVARKWDIPRNMREYINGQAGDEHWLSTHPCHTRMRAAIWGDANAVLSTDESSRLANTTGAPRSIKAAVGRNSQLHQTVDEAARTGQRAGQGIDAGLLKDMHRQGRAAMESVYAIWDDLGYAERAAERWRIAYYIGWCSDLVMMAASVLGFAFDKCQDDVDDEQGVSPGQRRRPRPLPLPQGPVVAYTTSATDLTAFDVAGRAMGSREYWRQVVDINGMLDARTNGDGSPLGSGQVLIVPAADGVTALTQDDLYGTDILLVDGDLVADGGDDILAITGLPNLMQNLNHRMLTVAGENVGFPEFGLPRLVGESDTTNIVGDVLSATKRQVVRDHRVTRVVDLKVTDTGGELNVSFHAEAATRSRTQTISTTYPGPV